MASPTLAFTVTEKSDNKSVDVLETTGVYSATNTGGWGAPNNVIGDATAATVDVTLPGSDFNVGTAAAISINVYPTLPNTTSTVYNITNVNLGLASSTELPDGIYLFDYDVSGNNSLDSDLLKYVLLFGQTECCLDKMLADLDVGDCGCSCDPNHRQVILDAFILLEAAKEAVNCGKNTKGAKIMKYLDTLCANSGCTNC